MTAEQIRAEAIERIAREAWAEHHRAEAKLDGRAWESERPAFQQIYRRWAARMVDALGDLLPTGVERLAAYAVTDETDDRLMQRYVTAWTDAPE
ncbi:hypothetical protein [Nocardia thailandica]|uniref:hypothetical protein n=1 Tax=Nocardia thailandica TaxID=257275 RepID=UPI0002F73EB4|nr:hypothetical protein [Nocardia thailandica]